MKQISGDRCDRVKMFFHGKRLKDIYVGASKYQVFKYRVYKLVRRLFIGSVSVTSAAAILYVGFVIGGYIQPNTVYAEKTVEVVKIAESPVMSRIADCESGIIGSNGRAIKGSASHYAKDGQVNRNVNKDGTIDTGYFMINSIHNKEATRMGYDLTKESDNKAYAMYLYANRGTQDWYSSAKCWN